MSPLILVGILVITTLNPSLADVKHVLEGSAHPPTCKCAENHQHYKHHDNQFTGGFTTSGGFPGNFGGPPNIPGSPNNAVPGSVAFWWADSNSPFKHAYEYFKKCSEKGNCFPPVAPGVQVSNTIQHGSVTGSFDSHKGHSASTASPFGPVDIKTNPFLNGQINGISGAGVTTHGSGGGQVNLGGNPFLHGQAVYSGSGEVAVTGSDGFLGVQPSVPFGKAPPRPFSGGSGQSFPTAHPSFHTSSSFGVNQGFQQTFPTAHPPVQPGAHPFPTAHPATHTSGSFGVNQGFQQTFPTAHPPIQSGAHPFPTAHPASHTSGSFGVNQGFQQSFSTGHPGKEGKFESCKDAGHVCVKPELCLNGLVKTHGQGFNEAKHTVNYCEIGKEVCCRLPEGAGTSYHPTGTHSTFTSSFTSSHTSSSGAFGATPPRSGFANLSDITLGKSSVPGSTIKFSGTAGLSPGLIQVLPVGQEAPNPHISTAGESGSSATYSGSSTTSKVVRDTTPNPNSVFSSTVDYSNDKLDQLSFVSTIRGPQYLPPVSTPVPPVKTPDLEPPHPPISTYQPSIPTTPRPFVTTPIIGGASVVSVHTPPQNHFFGSSSISTTQRPFSSTFGFSSTQKPYVQSTPTPFITSRQPVFPTYTTKQPSYIPPKQTNEYLPPYQPSSSKPFVTQSPYTRPSVTYTHPPVTQKPTFVTSYIPPQTPAKPYVPPVHPSTSKPFTYKPYSPPTYKPQPTQTVPHVTGGYTYSKPTPPFELPSKPIIPSGTINIGQNYVTTKQPGYSYPTPTPPFVYPNPSTPKPVTYVPPSTYKPIYTTPKPVTTQATYTFTNKYVPPSSSLATNKYVPPHPTPGYQYPTPSPPFDYPKQPSTPRPNYDYNNNFISTKQTLPPYKPPVTQSTGYRYPTPTPSFSYPSPSPSIPQPTRRPPANNEYLPPRDENPFETIRDNAYIPPPPSDRTPEEGKTPPPSVLIPFHETPNHYAGCAAALKCVQEIYCTADGFISSTPVVLTREQELLRVPTTECVDKDSGIAGKCCRDPNYVDPWPSANLINGIDNGQYREDPTLGQYFPQKQRPSRSEITGNNQNLLPNNGVKTPQHQQFNSQAPVRIPNPFNTPAVVAAASNNDNTCGIRNPNIQPHGPGELDAGFAEIPWQAMVLRDTNRSLLCGGAIVKSNAVLTAAHCVEGLATSDILIKAGEWKLGIDEEPLPFQIVKVAAIIPHPNYKPGVYLNDLALLMLEERLRIVDNVAPICLPATNQPPPPQTQCIVTGWGKHVLQVHLRDAIMRSIDVNILDNNQCSNTLNSKYQHVLQHYSPENTICAYSSKDQCKVDYGSALACSNGNGQYTLAGIFSWDTGCKDETQIGAYCPPDVEWIESTCSKPLTHLKALDRQYRNHQ
ncbi:hypothetical protein ILUMI_00373 [Ignelater luminosus]|uniref:Peptidase S1 domain-containing protein n=1 Tax=Ignelater luminosus TaxID=2038154 RepID=A0A8K0GIG9_IGNLU|nr:hypothetical protein ILUMI_00373 [Ignelater luminosus]